MKSIFLSDTKSYFIRWGFHLFLLLIISFAVMAGANAHFSISEDVYSNAPYQISFIIAFISLTSIFFSTLFATQLLFKEADARFELILFSTAIQKKQFVIGRYLSLFFISFICLLLLTAGFFTGYLVNISSAKITSFNFIHYAYPFLIFGAINTFFTTAVLCFTAWLSKNKMLVYVSGLLLYIFYMLALVYSGSPLMAQSLPQSEQARFISAIIDPFGFSAFFYQTSGWQVLQRNTQLVSLQGIFLLNRLLVFSLSAGLLFVAAKKFSFTKTNKYKKNKLGTTVPVNKPVAVYKKAVTNESLYAKIKSLFSFTKIYLIYIVKSFPFIITTLVILFAVGMEMYAEIEKGIRIPQKYASSGLMVSTINQTFYGLGCMIVLFYAYEIFWRSRNVNFFLIEETTSNFKWGYFAKWLSLSVVLILFSLLMMAEGIAFQLLYQYPKINLSLYASVFLTCSLPLILLAGFLLLIQKTVNRKYTGLACIVMFTVLLATALGNKIISFPLLKFLHTINIDYSDMNGFGAYLPAFEWRLLFGFSIIILLNIILSIPKIKLIKWQYIIAMAVVAIVSIYSATKLLSGYKAGGKEAALQSQANYENAYRKYAGMAQPIITDIMTVVDLYPEKNAYNIKASYQLQNKSGKPISKLLVNFSDGFIIKNAVLQMDGDRIHFTKQYEMVVLQKPMQPGSKASFEFEMSYSWKAVNGHQSFNAIVENGSFMRISRYYPQFGYLPYNEIQGERNRKKFHLSTKTPLKPFDAPKEPNNDFINLDMTVSTTGTQEAIGVGELIKRWNTGSRNYFRYKTSSPIPFRFALSSAVYAVKKENYKGKDFEIYYTPAHVENVAHLLLNAKLTMDYCEANFGPYPFKTIRFAEISSFTRGFAATAYPATIYMTEDMIFHSNLKGDKQQDVINELAGHELSHLWWGGNQTLPDDREGASMLTETFAMYTEMMLLKKMYGKEKMLDRIRMHAGIYRDEKGFSEEEPLYRVKSEDAYISYSKGAVVMYQLSEMIGEDKVNLALRNYLAKNKYPNPKPVSTDFLDALYKVTDVKIHPAIEEMFTKVNALHEKSLLH